MQSWRGASSSPGLRPPDHRDHRVAEILHPFRQAMGLDLREAGVTKVKLDEVSVTLVIELPPDRNRLCPKAPVREADDERRAGPQHSGDLAEDRHGLLQVLDRDADHR